MEVLFGTHFPDSEEKRASCRKCRLFAFLLVYPLYSFIDNTDFFSIQIGIFLYFIRYIMRNSRDDCSFIYLLLYLLQKDLFFPALMFK